jgi:hypothetical protein
MVCKVFDRIFFDRELKRELKNPRPGEALDTKFIDLHVETKLHGDFKVNYWRTLNAVGLQNTG